MNFKLTTYNSQGHGLNKLEYLSHLLQDCDILLWQEHWYFNKELDTLECKFGDTFIYGVSGMDDDLLLTGRPYGGCAILYHKNLPFKVHQIPSHNKRYCAIRMSFNDIDILVINVYMPCDIPYDKGNSDEYTSVLIDIKSTILQSDCNYVIIGGDFNANLNLKTSVNVNSLTSFLSGESLLPCKNHGEIDYTFESKISYKKSILDHFFVSDNFVNQSHLSGVAYGGDNLSDHCPLSLVVNVKSDVLNTRNSVCDLNADNKGTLISINWRKASAESLCDYKLTLDEYLHQVPIPWSAIKCTDVNCRIHNENIEKFHNDLIQAAIYSSQISLPVKQSKTLSKCISGWKDHVSDYKGKACLWHYIWKQNGSPPHGLIADIRRSTRLKYHNAIKYVKKNQSQIRNSKLAESLSNNKPCDFWNTVKNITGKKKLLPNTIDNTVGDRDIADLFANKWKRLYNSVGYNNYDLKCLDEELNNDILHKCCQSKCMYTHCFTVNEIVESVKKLKHGKHNGRSPLYSDHIIYASHKFHVCLALLFSSMLTHNYAPQNMLICHIIPLVKN